MLHLAFFLFLGLGNKKPAPVRILNDAPDHAVATPFHDSKYGVRFNVPAGWSLTKKDHEVSTFRPDTPKTTARNEMRAVATMDFNPFPLSTLSGMSFYYSVQRHATDRECEEQGVFTAKKDTRREPVNIGGLNFLHDHVENGKLCLESRDDVYVAFHKGSCYRFDVVVNLFCSRVSGAQDLTLKQMNNLEGRASDIFSSMTFDWEKSGPTKVPPPEITPDEPFETSPPKPTIPSAKL